MLTKLMQIVSLQEDTIERQAGVIDELFLLLCQYANDDDFKGFSPLLQSIEETSERMDELCMR